MSLDGAKAEVHDALDSQLAALREDLARLSADRRRSVMRIAKLEHALQLVRDLMRDLPAHDNITLVAIRLRVHFANFAGDVIADALADEAAIDAE